MYKIFGNAIFGNRIMAAKKKTASPQKNQENKSPKAKKPRATTASNKRKRIIAALLEQTAAESWQAVTLPTISDATGITLSDVCELFPTKQAILYAFLDDIDQHVQAEATPDKQDETPRDRLFDVLMCRFDLLQPHKDAIINILKDMPKDPITGLCGIPRFGKSMAAMLETAQLSSKGFSGKLKIKGLGLVHLNTVRVWLQDDTLDMSKTMAALDQSLQRADSVAAVVFNH
jgi:hypothetical protein